MYIRTRLTLWFLFILTLLLVAFSITIYQLTHSQLLTWVDQDVHQQATTLRVASTYVQERQDFVCLTSMSSARRMSICRCEVQNGTVLASSSNLEQHMLPILSDTPAAGQMKEMLVDKLLLFVYCQPIMINHQLQGYVIAAHAPQTIYYALSAVEKHPHSRSH